ncbi:MAG: hypothetical protein IJ736_13320 [Firmicutes bacterium]|nr:hypothetical protein [Bacillota bacterium]
MTDTIHILKYMKDKYNVLLFLFYMFMTIMLCIVLIFDIGDNSADYMIRNISCSVLCMISSIKSLSKIAGYYVKTKRSKENYKEIKEKYFSSKERKKDFMGYRTIIALYWLFFVICCVAANFVFYVDSISYLIGVYFLFALDIVFCTNYCFLNQLAYYLTKTKIKCCYGCPVRGWDMLMLTSPVLFLYNDVHIFSKIWIIISVALSIIAMAYWEKIKFYFISIIITHEGCDRICNIAAKHY